MYEIRVTTCFHVRTKSGIFFYIVLPFAFPHISLHLFWLFIVLVLTISQVLISEKQHEEVCAACLFILRERK